MTTNVKIDAHVPAGTVVQVEVFDGGELQRVEILKNGQDVLQYVYDGREIRVKEIKQE